MDRGSQAREEVPSPQGQPAPDELRGGTAQPEVSSEVEATAPQVLKFRSDLGSREGGWEKQQPEQKLGGWTCKRQLVRLDQCRS